LIADADLTANDAPRAVTVNELFEDALTISTYTNANINNISYGTSTGTRLVSTNASITTGTIPNLTSSTATITGGTFSGSINSTSGTIATLNSTTGTIPTLVATTLITTGTGTAAAPAIVPTGDTNTGIFFPAADTIAATTQGTERLRIDSSGQVGVGVTPSGWGASEHKAIQVGIGGSISGRVAGGDQDKVNVAANVYNDGTVFKYIASDEATIYQQTGGIHIFSNAPSGTADSTATFTERLRIDASGNVGIGTTSPLRRLHAEDSANSIVGRFSSGQTSSWIQLAASGTGTAGRIGCPTGDSVASVAIMTNDTERLRINASGNVGIGTTSPQKEFQINATEPTIRLEENGAGAKRLELSINSSAEAKIFANQSGGTLLLGTVGTERLRIDSSGGVTIAGLAGAGSRAVNASAAGLLSAASDASLKEEVVGAHIAGLHEILQIHPKMYRWKDDIANRGDEASVELGFIANDVAPIIPSAAPLGNDGLYGFYDRSITAALVKAVQELKSENDTLKSRIEALEAA
jgi:hypothetical protein